MPPTLTVAIPTYNRAAKLTRILDVLSGQIRESGLTERISILISDNCSTDGTPAVIRRFAETNKDLRIATYRQGRNIGIVRNLWWLYEQTTSDYCWYFADDDVLKPGAVSKILGVLEEHQPRVLLYSFEQPPGSKGRTFDYPDSVALFTDPADISSLIVRWPKISIYIYHKGALSTESETLHRETLEDHGYIHLMLALSLFQDNPRAKLAVISEQLASCDDGFTVLRTPANDWGILHKVFEHPYIQEHAPKLAAENGPRHSYYLQIVLFWAWKCGALQIDDAFKAEYEAALAQLPLRWSWLLSAPGMLARALIMRSGIASAPRTLNRLSAVIKGHDRREMKDSPPQRRRFTIISLVFQYISLALSMGQGLLLVPLFLQHLSLPLYGAWLAMSSVAVWLTLLDPGVSAVFQQRVSAAYGRGDKASMEEAIGTGVALNALVYGLLFIAAAVAAPFLPKLLHMQGPQSQLLVDCFLLKVAAETILALALTIASVPIALMAFPLTLGTCYSMLTAAGLGLTVWMLISGWGLIALPAGALLRSVGLLVVNGAIALWTCRGTLGIRPRISRAEFQAVSGLTGYSWVGKLGSGMTGEADAFLIGHFLGPASVPIMTLTRNASDIIQQISSRVTAAFLPSLTHLHSQQTAEGSREITLRLMRIVMWTAALGFGGYIALNERFVGLWVGAENFGGRKLTLLFAGLLLWQGVGRALGNVLFGLGRIRESGVGSATEAVLRVGILYLMLTYSGGLTAAPVAGLIAAAATGAWLFPLLLGRELKLTTVQIWDIAREFAVCSAAMAGLGYLWPLMTPLPHGWIAFIVQTVGFSLCGMSLMILTSPCLRDELQQALCRARS